MNGPLAGLRVVEFSGIGPGPLAGQLLADLGADVVTIDRASYPAPDRSDVNRRNKRSVALDLRRPEGVEAALRLINHADVLIEGFRPGVMERLGLGPEDCRVRHPRLVYGRMTGWGQTGPLAQTAGHDLNYLALTGALGAIGPAEGPPLPPLNLVADFGGGAMFLVFGVLAALFERSRSGLGQVIDAAMVDGVPAMMGLLYGLLARGQWSERRGSNLLDGGAPFYACYATFDGRHMALGAIEPPFFADFLLRAGLPAEWSAAQADPARWPALREAIAEAFARHTQAHWCRVFDGSDACVAPVLAFSEAAAHAHLAARHTLSQEDGVWQAAPAPRFDRTPARRPRPPGALGADTEAALAEAGATSADLQRWRQAGALT
jgi:alpha-methylacyl-CoA racemase